MNFRVEPVNSEPAPNIRGPDAQGVRMKAVILDRDLGYMSGLFEAGKLAPVIDGPYRLADLPDAFRHFATGDHKGKIVVRVA